MTTEQAVRPGADAGTAAALDGLRHAFDRLSSVISTFEQGGSDKDVVTCLIAVSKALHRAGFAIIAGGLRACATGASPARGCTREPTADELVALFLRLA